MSVRDITELADANTAAIHYHFGSKQDLIAAVLERRAAAMGQRREELLSRLEGQPTVELRDVVQAAIVQPTAELVAEGEGGRNYVAFLAALGSHAELVALVVDVYDPYTERCLPRARAGDPRAARRRPTPTFRGRQGSRQPPARPAPRADPALDRPSAPRNGRGRRQPRRHAGRHLRCTRDERRRSRRGQGRSRRTAPARRRAISSGPSSSSIGALNTSIPSGAVHPMVSRVPRNAGRSNVPSPGARRA